MIFGLSSERLLALLLECTIKASLLFLMAFAITRLMQRKPAAMRHAVWAACLLGAVSLPFLVWALPDWSTAQSQPAAELWKRAAAVFQGNEAAGAPFTTNAVEGGKEIPLKNILFLLWAAGATVSLAILAVGYLQIVVLASRSEPVFVQRWMRLVAELSASLGLRRSVRLLKSKGAVMPVTWGMRNPKILLPAGFEEWTEDRMRMVLSHELAHVRRNDWAMHMAAELCRALYWFNPIVWIAGERLRQESERACDDAVLGGGVEGAEYAEHLLEIARTLPGAQRRWTAALAMARQSNLERRFVAMLDPSLERGSLRRGAAVLAGLAAIAVLIPLSAVRAPGQSTFGVFSGSVLDASTAAVPNATVILSNRETKSRDMTTTGASGQFEFHGLLAGTYTVDVLKPGFERFVAQSVVLGPNESRSETYTLRLGAISETIDVIGEGLPRSAEALSSGKPTRVKVGGSVQAAKMLKMVRPPYPAAAKAAGIEGRVLLDAVISREGVPLAIRVANSQIDPDLAKAAVESVQQWRYQPTLLNGEPVEILTTIQVNYTLQK